MKVLFSADWHIKLGQKNVPVEWAKNRYDLLFEQLNDILKETKPDYFIIGGDIFDKLPNMEELAIFFKFLVNVESIKIVIYSGNHEAIKKNTTFLSYLKDTVTVLNSNALLIDDFYSIENIDFIPYNKLKEYHPADIDFHGDILCTHVRGNIPPHVQSEVPLDLFSRWDVVLAGDLHSYENCQENILYPGSPVTTSFHRSKVDTGVILFDTKTKTHEWIKLNLPQLIRKTVKAGEPVEKTDFDWTVYEIEGNMAELSSVEDNEIIDKKVSKRSTDSALILDATMTMEDELKEYLQYILMLEEDTIEKVIKLFHDRIKTT